ncbi:MAG: hypothetical protein QNI99_17145 [Woeseiaceae bacterium]|nr:hypothetical protein [Woeseiaceae bacterium]
MAAIDESRYIVVRDLKGYEDGARLGILQAFEDRQYSIDLVPVSDWMHPDGRPSDLEAVCSTPWRPGEFLILESGRWNEMYGRLFHMRIESSEVGDRVDVLHVYELPEFDGKGPDDPGDEMEGLACAPHSDGRTLVMVGERGGSAAYPNGLLRWFTMDPDSHVVQWTPEGRTGLEVDAPGEWHVRELNRDISALHLFADGTLWAAATDDVSDVGPFSSVVYLLGQVWPDVESPIRLLPEFTAERTVSGFKIEGLADGTEATPISNFAIGTEDEVFGGTWRPLH